MTITLYQQEACSQPLLLPLLLQVLLLVLVMRLLVVVSSCLPLLPLLGYPTSSPDDALAAAEIEQDKPSQHTPLSPTTPHTRPQAGSPLGRLDEPLLKATAAAAPLFQASPFPALPPPP